MSLGPLRSDTETCRELQPGLSQEGALEAGSEPRVPGPSETEPDPTPGAPGAGPCVTCTFTCGTNHPAPRELLSVAHRPWARGDKMLTRSRASPRRTPSLQNAEGLERADGGPRGELGSASSRSRAAWPPPRKPPFFPLKRLQTWANAGAPERERQLRAPQPNCRAFEG